MTHHGSSPRTDSPIRAAPISALSAIGSAILPKSVTRLCRRASSPSIRSVTDATANATNAATRQAAESPPSWKSATRKTGTSTRRSTVRALATFQLLAGGRHRRRHASDLRQQVGAVGPDDLGPHQVADARQLARARRARARVVAPSTSGAWCAARPSATPPAGSSDSTSTSSASPTRSSARCATSSSARRLTRSTRSRTTSSSRWPVQPDRLGAVLVAVAEDADRVEPGAGEERLELGQVVLGLAGEADDDVGPDARVRRGGADPLDQVEEALGVAEAAHPPQHRGAGVLERQVEVGRHTRRRRDHVDQAGPHLGRLQVADPHPAHPVDGGQLGQQRLEQAQVAEVLAVRRRVLAHEHQLAHPVLRQPAGLGQHVGGPARHEGAAEGRDGAEAAPPVAAGRELQRRDRSVGRAHPRHRRGVEGRRRPVDGRSPAAAAAGPAARAGTCGSPARTDWSRAEMSW